MGNVVNLHHPETASPRRGTGFAYCPPPTPRGDRAFERGKVYTRDVLILVAIGAAGAAWMVAAALFHVAFGAS